jgi:hypothetical protein
MGSADLPEFAVLVLTATRSSISPAYLANKQNYTATL